MIVSRRRLLFGCATALLAAATAVAAVAVTSGDRGEVPGTGVDGHADVRLGARSFRITGDAVRPLSPGRSAPINVRFANPHGAPLRVTGLRVRVRAVSAPNSDAHHRCSRRDYTVRQVRPGFAVRVPGHVTRSLSGLGVRRKAWPRVGMLNRPVNQDGCKGASLTLAYVGSGSLRR